MATAAIIDVRQDDRKKGIMVASSL